MYSQVHEEETWPATHLCASVGINNMVNARKECYEMQNLKAGVIITGLGRLTIRGS